MHFTQEGRYLATLHTKMSVRNKKANFSRYTQRTQPFKSRNINYHLLYAVFIEPFCTGTFNPLMTSSHVCLRWMFQNRHNTGSDLLQYQSYSRLLFSLTLGGSSGSAVSVIHLKILCSGTSMVLATACLPSFPFKLVAFSWAFLTLWFAFSFCPSLVLLSVSSFLLFRQLFFFGNFSPWLLPLLVSSLLSRQYEQLVKKPSIKWRH